MNTKEKAVSILNKLAAVNLSIRAREALAREASLDQLDDTLDKLFQVRTQQDAAAVLRQHGQQPSWRVSMMNWRWV